MSGWSPPEVISFKKHHRWGASSSTTRTNGDTHERTTHIHRLDRDDRCHGMCRHRQPVRRSVSSALLIPLAVLVAVTQRSKLARSMDVTDCDRRRRKRLKASAMLAASLPVIYLVSLPLLGDDWGTDAVVALSVWFAVLIAAACYFVAGISTPKSPAATHLRTG